MLQSRAKGYQECRLYRGAGSRSGPRAIRGAGCRAGLETVLCMALDNFYSDLLHIVSLPSNSFCFFGQCVSSSMPQFPHTVDPEPVFYVTVMLSYIKAPSSPEQHLTCGQWCLIFRNFKPLPITLVFGLCFLCCFSSPSYEEKNCQPLQNTFP